MDHINMIRMMTFRYEFRICFIIRRRPPPTAAARRLPTAPPTRTDTIAVIAPSPRHHTSTHILTVYTISLALLCHLFLRVITPIESFSRKNFIKFNNLNIRCITLLPLKPSIGKWRKQSCTPNRSNAQYGNSLFV